MYRVSCTAALVLALLALTSGFLAFAPMARAVEQAPYQVELADGAFEVRSYAPRVVAELRLDGSFEGVGNDAFRPLAAYIGGANRTKASIAMTAPVTQESSSEKIAMTAPVTQQSDGASYRVCFVMPADQTLATLPEPTDPRILLREEPARTMATVRYRGTWTEARYRENLALLRAWLPAHGLAETGAAPVWARYDPPFMPWFLRRNEVLIEVERAR
jgi:hypothetical protein